MATNAQILTRVKRKLLDQVSFTDAVILLFLNQGLLEIAGEVLLPPLATSVSLTTHTDAIEAITLGSGSNVDITATAHGLTNGDRIYFAAVGGTTELSGETYTITVPDADSITLDGTDGDDFTAWISGGTFHAPYVAMPSSSERVYHRQLQHVMSKEQDTIVPAIDSWRHFLGIYYNLDDSGEIDHVCVRGNGENARLYYQPTPIATESLTAFYYRRPIAIADNSDEPDGLPPEFAEGLLVNYAFKELYDEMGRYEQKAASEAKYEQMLQKLKDRSIDDILPEFVGEHAGTPLDGYGRYSRYGR